jgi:hypothetical protein
VSVQLAAVYAILLLMIGVSYYISLRAKRKVGETLRFRDFLLGAFVKQKTKSVHTYAPSGMSEHRTHNAVYEETLTVLEEIYRDVHATKEMAKRQAIEIVDQRVAELRAEIEALQSEIRWLKEQILHVAEHPSSAPSNVREAKEEAGVEAGRMVERPHRTGANSTYYQILDELQNGKDAAQIAKELGLGVAEVEIVRRLMSMEE